MTCMRIWIILIRCSTPEPKLFYDKGWCGEHMKNEIESGKYLIKYWSCDCLFKEAQSAHIGQLS